MAVGLNFQNRDGFIPPYQARQLAAMIEVKQPRRTSNRGILKLFPCLPSESRYRGSSMVDVCYLCGKPLLRGQVRSDDHVVPATLIARTQPKVKGFDYGGYLPTHETCNNHFGNETYVSKALDLLRILHGLHIGGPLQHTQQPNISILPLNASQLSHFTTRDLQFFKIYDARQSDAASF